MAGEGSPAVIPEGGLGAGIASWSAVQKEIAKCTRTVSYDRAGLGQSEPGPKRRSAKQVAAELHSALAKAGASPPYVTLLTAMQEFEGIPKEARRVWMAKHQESIDGVPGGKHVLAEKSGHFIQLQQPDLVIQAVRQNHHAFSLSGSWLGHILDVLRSQGSF